MPTTSAIEVRPGNIVKIEGAVARVVSQEMRGTGQFGKSIHFKLKNLTDGRLIERSVRAEEKVELIETRQVKLQYLYRDGGQFVFMDSQTFEQASIPAAVIGRQEIFLKENSEVSVIYIGGKPVTLDFSKIVELKVMSTPPGVKGQSDTTFKEAELENGLKILIPQFVREGETIRVNTEDLSYLDRVTTKSLKSGSEGERKEK